MDNDVCEKQLTDQRFSDHERRLDELTVHVQKLDMRTAEHGGLIRSVDSRTTELIKDMAAQTAQIGQLRTTSTEENGKILHKVEIVENTLTDFAQSAADTTKQLRTVKESVTTLDKSFNDYVEANSENMATVQTIGVIVDRIETFIVAAYNETKTTAKKVIKIAMMIAVLWAIYKLFPGLKPLVENALKVGTFSE